MPRRRLRTVALAVVAAALAFGPALAETVRIGVIAPFSGPFARYGEQFQQAVDVYVAQNGDSPGGHEVEWLWRDSGGPDPARAKALARELIVSDGVDYLAGFTFTPNAMAVAPLIGKAKIPTVIFNAATSRITEASPFFVRASHTLAQLSAPAARHAWAEGARKAVTAVSDYAPGHNAEEAFARAFEAEGGEVLDRIRMPLRTTDFAPFVQRIKDSGADALFVFLPVGPPTFAFVKAYNDNALAEAGIEFYGTGETDETALEALGDAALGLTTLYHYSAAHESPANAAFQAKLAELHPGAIANFMSVGAYDGAHLLWQMIEAAGGSDPEAALEAVKGLEWQSPRGPLKLDPETRHVTQNVYVRQVERDPETGKLVNRELETLPAQPDWGLVGE